MNIYGASGHAKVIIDIVHLNNEEKIDLIIDDNPQILEIMGYRVEHQPDKSIFRERPSLIGIGNNKIRKKIAGEIEGKIQQFISHNAAVVSPSAQIGKGTVIMANAAINAEAIIGEHCIVNTGAVVEHEVILEDFVHISPNATIAGNVKIGEGTHIGIGAAVIPGINIGKWTVIGAGAVIIDDIPDYAVVVGNPGKIIKYNKVEDE